MTEVDRSQWAGFQPGCWQQQVDVRDFIQTNYTPYTGASEFLCHSSERTLELWRQVRRLLKAERDAGGPLDFDPNTPAAINAHGPGYIDADLELIVGLQTDAPLKRAIMPYGGIRMVETSCDVYGKALNETVRKTFTEYRKPITRGCSMFIPQMCWLVAMPV